MIDLRRRQQERLLISLFFLFCLGGLMLFFNNIVGVFAASMIGLGGLLNFIVVHANSNKMPVRIKTKLAVKWGFKIKQAVGKNALQKTEGGDLVISESVRFGMLADRIGTDGIVVMSIGDLLAVFGFLLCIISTFPFHLFLK